MKNLSLLAILGVSILLAGCQTNSSPSLCGCGSLPANCCSWDWYQKCDLIEGRVDRDCPVVCGQPRCAPGVIATRCYDLPKTGAPAAPAASVDEVVVEEELPPPATEAK